jgi:hypothetical protein
MSAHSLNYRYETRLSHLGLKFDNAGGADPFQNYPCLENCAERHIPSNELTQGHDGQTRFIYALCSCGWELYCGDHIYEEQARTNGRFLWLEHRIVLCEAKP